MPCLTRSRLPHLTGVSFLMALVAVLVMTPPLLAQDVVSPAGTNLVSSADLEQAVLDHAAATEMTRRDLTALLESPEVQDIVEERGLSLERLHESAEGMSDRQVRATAPLLERAAEAIQNGGTITISVYTVIIILLLLILLT